VFRLPKTSCNVGSVAAPGADQLEARRLETVTDLMSGWVWETDPEHRFTYMSDSVERFTGRPASWHYGRTREQLGNACGPEH
jgi:PAS domain-containing protein